MPFRRDGLWFLLPPADLKGVGFRLLNLEWQKMSATGIQYSNSFNLSEAGGALGSSLTVMWKVAQGEGEAPCWDEPTSVPCCAQSWLGSACRNVGVGAAQR